MSDTPKNGDMIQCDRCQACHRLSTPVDRFTGRMAIGILAFNCAGRIRIAYSHGVLSAGLKIVEPVGLSALASEQITPRVRIGQAKGRKGQR